MKTGWIGVGNMGFPMARNILAGGHEVAAFDPRPERLSRLRGARAADSVADACRGAAVVFSSIPDDFALRRVALGEQGVLASAGEGAAYVDMSTVSPHASREVAAAAERRGLPYLRAPVSGSVVLAESASLTVIASGPEPAFETCLPLLKLLGSKVYCVGDEEQARYLKLAINNMVHATAVAMAEALAVGRRGGLEWRKMLEVMAASVVGSPLVQYKAEALKDRDFSPASFVATAVKDQDLFIDAAEACGVELDIAPVLSEIFHEMLNSEDLQRDFFATVLRTERRSGLDDP